MTTPVGSTDMHPPPADHSVRDGAVAATAAIACSLATIAAAGTAWDALSGPFMLMTLIACCWLAVLLTRGAFRCLLRLRKSPRR